MDEEWRRKVMVKVSWVERCLKAGRFLVRPFYRCHQPYNARLGFRADNVARGNRMTGRDVESGGE